ncbi:ShlB/FhaC/HecB family hemolysin secretion/activation protein [Robbsia sp. KACC 23696]|uniref:ShlB/FhaC/HecB family hemolysin secretion/activation protein n=1 Tax=Robbsia sp. KACC 23696 TaxID=3149231 RepID=UPI00325A4475
MVRPVRDRTHLVCVVVGLVLHVTGSFAQSAPPPAPGNPIVFTAPRVEQDPAQRLLQEQRDRQRREELQQQPAQIAVPQVAMPNLPVDADVETLPDVAPLFLIDRIVFSGDAVLPAKERDRIVAPFLHKHLGRQRIDLLLRRITEAFIAHGFITTRAYLGSQNLASGTLMLNIVAGKLAHFTLNGEPIVAHHTAPAHYPLPGGGLFTDAGTEWAFATHEGALLRLPDLEQGVDQINRLRRNQAEIQIMPGQQPGDSIVAIKNHIGSPFSFDLGIDNYGSAQTGTLRYRAGVEADNVIGWQESLSFNYVGTQDSNAVVFSAALPFGYQTFSYTTSLSEYQQLISDVALLEGRTFSQILGWNDVLTRSRSGRISLDVTLTKMRTERSVNGIALTPQNMTILRVGLSGLYRFTARNEGAAATWDAGVSEGLPWLSATHDSGDIDREEAHSQFTKFDLATTLQVPMGHIANASLTYRGQLSGQYSPTALFGNAQIFLGGMQSVRGFTEGGISGDSGVLMRNEAAWQNVPEFHGATVQPYLFLDAGKAHLIAQSGWPTLMGAGMGVRAQWRFHSQTITSEVLVGQALLQPAALGKKASVLLATLNWSD